MYLKRLNVFTMQPRDKQEKRFFWKFKIKGIKISMWFWLGIVAISGVLMLIRFVFTQSTQDLIVLIAILLNLALWLSLIYASQSNDNFIYLLPIVRVVFFGMFLVGLDDLDLKDAICDPKLIFTLIGEEVYIDFVLIFDLILLSPSLKISVLAYVPIWLVTHILYSFKRFDMSDSVQVMLRIIVIIQMFFTIFFLYYITTLQDLFRFFDQREVIRSE